MHRPSFARRWLLSTTLLPLALAAVSCSNQTPTNIAGPHGFVLTAERVQVLFADGGIGDGSDLTLELFNRDSSRNVDGGAVAFNDIPLVREFGAASGVRYEFHVSGTPVSPIRDPGLVNVLRIPGAAGFAAVTDSIASPAALAITLPAPGASISRAAGGTITWTGSGTDSVTIRIANTLQGFLRLRVPDNGILQLTPLDMNMTLTGIAYLIVSRTTHRSSTGPDGMHNFLSATTTAQVEVTIKP